MWETDRTAPQNQLYKTNSIGVFQYTDVDMDFLTPSQWRHNGHDSVSNYQPHDCLLNHLSRRRSKKTSKFRVTGLCAGNSPGTGEFPAQMASNAENVSIWWRHHDEKAPSVNLSSLLLPAVTRAMQYLSKPFRRFDLTENRLISNYYFVISTKNTASLFHYIWKIFRWNECNVILV